MRRLFVTATMTSVTAVVIASTLQSTGRTGVGQVFLPNPVASLQDQTLTDNKDADYPALQPAYRIVALTNLDGSGYLRGDWANIVSETGAPAFSPSNTFIYARNEDQFEQVLFGAVFVFSARAYALI